MAVSMGIINKNYISALDPSLDVRAIDHQVYDIWREDSFTDIMSIGDRKEPVTQPFYVSFTNNQLFYRGQVNSVTSGSGSGTVVVVMKAAGSGLARKGVVCYFANGASGIVTALSTSASIDTLTIATDSENITVVGNDYVNFGGVLVGERSISPTNARYGYTKYSNKIGIFSEVCQISNVQAAGKLEAEVDGQDSVIFKDHLDKLRLLKGAMNMEFIMGRISSTSFSDSSPALVDPTSDTFGGGGALQRGRGLYQYITTFGTALSAVGSGSSGSPVPNGTITLADFDTMSDALIAARAPKEQLVVSSSAVKRSIDKLVKQLNSSGITSVRLNVGGKELDAQVDKFSYSGFDYNFTTLGVLDHQNVTGTVVGKSLMSLPLDFKVPVYTEGKGVSDKPAIGLRYIKSGSIHGNELIGETYTGALAPYPNGSVQEFRTIWTAMASLEFKAPSFGVSMQVTA